MLPLSVTICQVREPGYDFDIYAMLAKMNKSNKWLLRIFDAVTLLALVLPGLFIIGLVYLFNDYGGPPSPEEQGESARLLIIGLVLVVSGVSMPLRSKKRSIVTLILITIAAMLILVLDGGQPDIAALYLVILAISFPLYFLRKKIAK
jgi:chromate transport protein ChrA